MKRQGMTKILTFMADIYSKFDFPKETEAKSKRFTQNWLQLLGEYDKEMVEEALKRLYSGECEKWAPSAPQLRGKVQDIVNERKRIERERKMQEMIQSGNHPELGPSDLEEQ